MDYFPLVRKVEFLVGGRVPLNIESIDKEDLERAFRNAQKVFNTRYETLASKEGSDIYAVNRSRSTNLTVGARGYIILGHFLTALLNQYIHDHTISELLLTKGDTTVYTLHPDVKPGQTLDSDVYPKVGTKDPDTVPDNIDAWFIRLIDDMSTMTEKFSSGDMNFKTNPADKIAAVKRFKFDLEMLKITKDDHRFQTYLFCVLQDFLTSYSIIFGYGAGSEKYIYLDTKSFDVFEALNDSSKMLEAFKAWHMDKIYSDYLKRKAELYKIDFSSFTLEGGYVVVPEDHYGKMIKDALDGVISGSLDELTWSNQIGRFEDDVVACAKISKMFRSLKHPVALNECYDCLIPMEDFDVVGKVPELEGKIAFFKLSAGEVCAQFEKFVDTIITRRTGFWFPTCSARMAIYNGVKTIYRFDFASPTRSKYLLYKVVSINDGSKSGKKKYIDDVVPLQAMSPEKGGSSVCEDVYITDCYKKPAKRNGKFYGTVDVPVDEIKIMLEQFKFSHGAYVDEDHWQFKVEHVILTILPPSQVVQSLNILRSDDSIRNAEGMEYVVQEIDTKDVESVDLVDLLFAYRKYELDDPKNLQNLYNKRLALIGHMVPTLEGYKLTEAPVVNVDTPNYGVLLQVSGVAEGIVTQTRSYRPKYMGVDVSKIVKGAKSRKFKLRRKLEVEFPIAKSSVSSYYIDKMGTDKVIYASGNTRFNEPLFKLICEDFDNKMFPDCYKGKLVLDIAKDVSFRNVKDPIESADGQEITFIADPPISTFDVVNPAYDEKMAIISEDGVIEDWKRFFSCPLVNKQYQVAVCDCVKDCFGEFFHGAKGAKALSAFKSNITIICDWMEEHFNIGASTLLTTVSDGFATGTFGDLMGAKDAEDTDAVIKIYKSIFGETSLVRCRLPLVRKPDYKQILDDSLYAIVRFPATNVEGSLKVPFIPGSVVKDVDSIQKVATLYVNQKLAQITDLW